MRVAFAIEHCSPRQGGAERYSWGLAQWLVAQGHELHVYTLREPETCPAGIAIHPLVLSALPGMARQARFAAALSKALAGESYDVVHGFNHVWPCDVLRLGGGVHLAYERYNALSAGSGLGRRAKQWANSLFPRYRALRVNERHQFDDPHRRFIAVSQRVADDMAEYYPSCRDRIHVIRNGLDLSVYNPGRIAERRTAARERFGVDEHTIVFLFASNNYRLKGLHDLVESLPLVRRQLAKSFRLFVVGRDNARPFKRLAGHRGVEDIVLFQGSADDLLDFYAAADALLHPTYYDACANVCLEAMACGLPVLTSRNNGAAEVMEDGDGCVLVDVPCPRQALAEAILAVADEHFRATAGEAQWRRAQAIPIEENYEAVLVVYDQVAAEKRGR